MNTNPVIEPQSPPVDSASISEICGEFDLRWSSGETPHIEDFLKAVPPEHQAATFERLLAIDLAYRGLSGVTVAEDDYRRRFPGFESILESAFRAHESISVADSHLRSHSSTVLWWNQVAVAVDPASVYQPQEMINRYRLIERVGRGGFGEVWKAWDTELNREVAIKLARSDRRIPAGIMDQLQAEAHHAASLKHSGIVPVYDIGRTPRGTYLVAEYIDGATLAMLLRRGAMPPAQAVDLTIQIAEALHHAHLRGLVHRDVKPGNILLRNPGHAAVLTDFGLAVTELEQLTESRSTVGTWWYMSPEQARGESHRVDARSDTYSLGVVLYQMLTGRLPFVASTRQEHLDQLLHRPPRPLRTIDDTIDPVLESICLKCLAKDSAERFTTCADLAAALQNWRESAETERLPSAGEHASPPNATSGRWKLISGMILMAAGISAGIYALAKTSSGRPAPPTKQAAAAIPEKRPGPPLEAVAPDGWRELMAQPPVIFAKSLGSIAEKPRFDSQQRLFTVRAEETRWIATAGELKTDEFEIRADISLKDWIGSGGVVWQLAVDTRFAPEKAYRCLGVEYRRLVKEDPAELRLMEFEIKEYGFDHRHLEHVSNITLQAVETPTDEWMTLECRVSPERITVRFGENVEWVTSDETPAAGWVPALTSACGITGTGAETRVRGLSVHAVR